MPPTPPSSVPTVPRLRAGDRVRLVSPSSFPTREGVDHTVAVLSGWGLRVELGDHVHDRLGYLAGRDEDRLADLVAAYADPGVRAVVATTGGAGAYRIAGLAGPAMAAAEPKPLVGYSDVTHLHLAAWGVAGVPGIHGGLGGPHGVDGVRRLLMDPAPTVLHRRPDALTAAVRADGVATGVLLGGHLTAVSTAVGVDLPDLRGAVLLLEAPRGIGLGLVDRQLTQLRRSGSLDGIAGVALGRFPGFEGYEDRGWTVLDVLTERLTTLGVPVLGGLEIGHGDDPLPVPLGTRAVLDAAAGTLTVDPLVH